MCKWGKNRMVWVKIPADLSATEFARFKYTGIDECIAPIVQALQQAGIDMRGSCCGHGECEGEIHLQDGRTLIILDKELSDFYWVKKGKKKKTIEILIKENW